MTSELSNERVISDVQFPIKTLTSVFYLFLFCISLYSVRIMMWTDGSPSSFFFGEMDALHQWLTEEEFVMKNLSVNVTT